MKLLKGVTVSVILFLLCFVAPFNIHAAGETQIVPTWSSSSQQSQWSNKFRVTNFCESSNDPQNYSCQLTITVNGDYYGYVYFDGYINNQIIWDYQTMFISGGKGTFFYTWYANGLQQINKVNIAGLSLVSPIDNIDLSQIISILTSINNYEQQIENSVDGIEGNQLTEITEIRNVVNELIKSNGYLEILSKLRNYNIFPESYIYTIYFLRSYQTIDYGVNSVSQINYPVFQVNAGDPIGRMYMNPSDSRYLVIMWVNRNIYNQASLEANIRLDGDSTLEWDSYVYTGYNLVTGSQTKIIKFYVNRGSATETINMYSVNNMQIIPFYLNNANRKNFSTDFALYFNLSNSFLDNINIIANGTTQSNQQSSDLSSGTDSMQQQMNSFTAQEDSYNQQMNNSINAIDFTSPVSQNAGILPAANFVISIFNGLIQNNAFSVLILIVCVLIIGKKVIGK